MHARIRIAPRTAAGQLKDDIIMRKRTPLLASAALGGGLILALAVPLAASAHITIDPNTDTAAPGSYPVVTFRVPNESATATTTKVVLVFPDDAPISGARYVPVPGWTAQVVMGDLPSPTKVNGATETTAVRQVVWTAQPGTAVGDGQMQLFTVSLSNVPDVGSIRIEADQYYSDGSIVRWDQAKESDEHPAPVLYVRDAPPAADGAHASADAGTSSGSADASDAAASGSADVLARVLGLLGLVVGALGVVFALVSLRRRTA